MKLPKLTSAQRRRRRKRERAESGAVLQVVTTDAKTGVIEGLPITTWNLDLSFKLKQQVARRKLLRRIPLVRHFVAVQPRPRDAASRPREARPRRRRATSKLARGPGRRSSDDDPLGDSPRLRGAL